MILRDPEFLLLLAAVALWLVVRLRPGARCALDFPTASDTLAAGKTWRITLRWIPTAACLAGLCLLIIAIARPAVVKSSVTEPPEGIDLVVLVDRSSSMGEPLPQSGRTCLELVGSAGAEFVRARGNDRLALVAFARTPETACAFSLDQDAVAERLAAVHAVERGSQEDGTAIGAGLAEAARLLQDSRAESRVVVLLTDGGENRFVIEPLAAARLCADRGVRVHTVALDLGHAAPDESEVDTSLHEKIASITGGDFHRITGGGGLERALAALDGMEKSPAEGRRFKIYEDRFRMAAVPGVCLLLLAMGLKQLLFRRAP